MNSFEVVAHRGVATAHPENTLPAFERAIDLGADAIELDVRLTKDKIPVVYHYYYLDETTSLTGPIFNYTCQQLQQARFLNTSADSPKISTLGEVLEAVGGKIGLEIEIKGPEPEAITIIGDVLRKFQNLWKTFEITSYEISLLLSIKDQCPGITTDLLYPRSEPWMNLDVVGYEALHKAKLAQARAVHLHPSQLSDGVVQLIRNSGIEIHAWDVNDEHALKTIVKYNIPKICTDRFELAANFRNSIFV
ncbi:MAG: glycerophosphodiester phosphodiesterase [Anaerolineales bacterium]|jgi:glycerophosphoryl diester phosphodiesterase